MITDIAHGEADLDTLKASASLIPAAKITKVPKVVKAIGNVGKTGFKKGKEGEKPFGSGLHRKTSQNLIRIKGISQKQVVRVVQQHLNLIKKKYQNPVKQNRQKRRIRGEEVPI